MGKEEASKKMFLGLLRSTKRKGMDNVLNWLEKSDFFTAPASTRFHGAYEGALVKHSLNVYIAFMKLRAVGIMDLADDSDSVNVPDDSVIISALLHDVCKANTYKVAQRWRKDKQNRWEQYDVYEFAEAEPLGHGEKSVMILQRLGLELTESEMYMIRWHMGGFDESKMAISNAMKKHPEIALMHSADLIATYIIENEGNKDAEK